MDKMQRPDKAEKITNPLSRNIYNAAKMLTQQGEHYMIQVQLTPELLQVGDRSSVIEMLTNYGRVERAPTWSRFISLTPSDLNAVRRLEDDYYDDKLAGIKDMELCPANAVSYHGKSIDVYLK